jgi:diacylglycerol kinase family enzyme
MASTEQDLRRELRDEREQLAEALETLRANIRSKVPLATAGALGLGFVASGGIGATARLLMRRGREGDEKAKAGRFSLVDKG